MMFMVVGLDLQLQLCVLASCIALYRCAVFLSALRAVDTDVKRAENEQNSVCLLERSKPTLMHGGANQALFRRMHKHKGLGRALEPEPELRPPR